MNTALLLVGYQNDFFPNGRIPLDNSVNACGKAQALLHAYREKQSRIVHIQHISTNPDANCLLPCTKGAEFYASVQPIKGEIIIKKHYPNSFKDTNLLNYLNKNQVKHLIICGMMTHLSIDATVRAAYDYGFTCTVIHDACATRQLEFNHMTISAQHVNYSFLAALQTSYATVLSSEDFLQRTGAQVPVAS